VRQIIRVVGGIIGFVPLAVLLALRIALAAVLAVITPIVMPILALLSGGGLYQGNLPPTRGDSQGLPGVIRFRCNPIRGGGDDCGSGDHPDGFVCG
jgi:hypothetical protein